MLIEPVEFKDFEELAVDKVYASTNIQYPALPIPSIKIDGIYYWSKKEVIAFGKAVERSGPEFKPK